MGCPVVHQDRGSTYAPNQCLLGGLLYGFQCMLTPDNCAPFIWHHVHTLTSQRNGSYIKVNHDSGGDGSDVKNVPQCINGPGAGGCTLEVLRDACNADAACDLFNTHGFLKKCKTSTPTTPAKPCQARSEWESEDTYYKVRSASGHEETDAGASGGAGAVRTAAAAAAGGEGAAAPAAPAAPAPAPPAPGAHGYGLPCGSSGSGCAGTFGKDLDFEWLPAPAALAAEGVLAFRGNTTRPDEHGVKGAAAIVLRDVPASITLKAGNVQQFIAVVVTTVAQPAAYDPVPDAIAEYESAAAPANASLLAALHTKAWSDIWAAGSVSVLGIEDDASGQCV